MEFKTLSGYSKKKNVAKYRIKWEEKSRSKYQEHVKEFLFTFWKNHVVYEEFPVVGSKMTLDIVNLTLGIAIEVQGEQHNKFNKFFHNNDPMNFSAQIKRDLDKCEWCKLNNLRLIEIFPEDLPLEREKFEETFEIKL